MWRSLLLGVLGIALGACDGSSPNGGENPPHRGGTGASGEAGAPGGDAGEGGSSGVGGLGGDAGTSGSGAAARGGSDPGGEGGDAGAAGDGNGAGSGGGGNAGMGGAGESAGGNGGNGGAGAGGIAGGGAGMGGAGMDGAGMGGAGMGGAKAGMAGADTGGAGVGGAGTGGAGMGGAGMGGGGVGGAGPTCTVEGCLEDLGANPCGAWSCSTTGECVVETATCVDRDGDGLGVGTSCTCNLDCDDSDAEVTSEKTIPCCRTGSGTKTCTNGVWQACTAGIPATAEACDGEDDDCDGTPDNGLGEFTCGMGVCRVSVPACVAGEVSSCVPGPPTSEVDGCNELDDDCDGAVDEDCSRCVHVAPNGDDGAALANPGRTPFRNVQPAIDFAAAHPDIAPRVCVAGGTSCGETATYPGPSGAELTMRNGIDVLGGYESTTWTRCATTHLAPTTGLGVLFPESVQELTILDSFVIDRVGAATTAGVSVRGGRGVLLSGVRIEGGAAATVSYGVNVTAGGEATVFRSRIDGGAGREEAVGVRSVGSRVFLEDNCGQLSAGRCAWTPAQYSAFQSASCSGAWIQGARASVPYRQIAVLLDGSPGSRIERSAVCSAATDWSNDPSGIHVLGDAANVLVRANSIALVRSLEGDSAALRMNDCRGAAPWVVDNHSILNTGSSPDGTARGVHAFGDCHPVVDSNTSIVIRSSAYGLSSALTCGTRNGTASRCVIVNNARIATESIGATAPSFGGRGVDCIGCVKVSRNSISGLDERGTNSCGMGCEIDSVGLSIASAEALIDRNRIYGGCALAGSTTGLSGSGNLRIQNNDIRAGSVCGVSQILRGPFSFTALGLGSGVQEVHSNYIDGGNSRTIAPIDWNTSCIVSGARYSGTGGIMRNNRFLAGSCSGVTVTNSAPVPFLEVTAASDPSVFENNSLGSYVNEGTTSLGVTQINTLTDMIASGNIGSCASTGATLVSGSTCIDAGTPIGAPLIDIDGDLRNAAPDIGPDEF